MTPKFIVAIDGPAGAGKSTIARRLARRLGFKYLDTGAMYRSLALKALRAGVDMTDERGLADLARHSVIDLRERTDSSPGVFLDGEDVSEAIRTPEVTNHTFFIARAALVREVMVEMQRAIGARGRVVMEGRDIGTVVFPDADCKFYLDAGGEERARRRHKEFLEQGKTISFAQVLADVQARDEKDFNRPVGPLKKAADAVVIDSTHMTIDQVVETMAVQIKGSCRDG